MNSEQRFLRQALTATLLVAFAMVSYRTYLFAASSYSGCGGEVVSPTNAAYEARVVELVNEIRATHNLPPMKLSTDLANSARYHAADMRQDDYVNHNTFDRENGVLVPICNWNTRIGVYYTVQGGLAENLSAGYATPQEAIDGWMNSTGHQEQILGSYREIGVGYDDGYWVQDFGDREDYYPLIINREAQQTDSPDVSLYIYGEWQQMRLRNDGGNWGEWQAFNQEVTWTLPNQVGERRVEVEVSNSITQASASDTIVLTTEVPATPSPVPTVDGPATTYLPTIHQ